MVNVPQFTMGGNIRDDWMQGAQGITNALGQYYQRGLQNRQMEQQQRQLETTNALARDQFGELKRQHDTTNLFARDQFGLARRSADRADELFPGQLDLQKAQIAHARAQGASELQLAPYTLEIKRNEALLAKAKAEGKDAESVMLRGITASMGTDPQQQPPSQPSPQQPGYAPGVRPQSFNGSSQPNMMPMSVADAGGPMNPLAPQPDANLILAQAAPQTAPQTAPQPPPPPSVRDVMRSMTPTQLAQFGMAYAGKGEAAKVLGEAAAGQKFGKEGANELDKQIIARVSDLSELDNIQKQFDPKYLEIGGRLKAAKITIQDYLNSSSITPEDKKYLTSWSRFAAATTERFNNRIKANAGTAVSGAEEDRMKLANPNTGDSPSNFEAKMKEQIYLQKAATMRFNWLRTRGNSVEKIAEFAKNGKIEGVMSLDDLSSVYDKRAAEIEAQVKQMAPTVQPQQLRAITKDKLRQEFGI